MYSAVKHDSITDLIKSEDNLEDVVVPELVKSEIKNEEDDFIFTNSAPELKSEVKSEVKLEEDNSFPGLVKTELKKEEDDLIFKKSFVCPHCSVQCDNEDLFVKHVQQYHVTTSSSRCFLLSDGHVEMSSICHVNSQAETGETSEQILRTYTGNKPFKCPVIDCPYRASRKSHLVRYRRTHTGEKPFKCPVAECSYRSSRKSCLERHKRIHTGEQVKSFQCSECSYRSSRNSHLVVHQRTHTGEKPYKCPDCPYRANHQSHLTRHKRTHTDENPSNALNALLERSGR